MKARRMIFCAFLVLLVVFAAGCSKLGQSKFFASSPDEVGVSGVSTPTQIVSTTKATPTTVAKATGKATAQPTTAQKASTGEGFYVFVDRPANMIPKGEISKRWSNVAVKLLEQRGVLQAITPEEATDSQKFQATIFVTWASLKIYKISGDIDKISDVKIPLPEDQKTAKSWALFTYLAVFEPDNKSLASVLQQIGVTKETLDNDPWLQRTRAKYQDKKYDPNVYVPRIAELAKGG